MSIPPERAVELFAIIADAAEGKLKPVTSLADCGMIGVYHTSNPTVRQFVDRMTALEGKDGVLSVSLGHGFPWGDVPDLGTRVLVVTDDDKAKGDALARQLADEFFALRDSVQPTYLTHGRRARCRIARTGAGRAGGCQRQRGRRRAQRLDLHVAAYVGAGHRQRGHRLHLGPDHGTGSDGGRRGRDDRPAHRRQDGTDVRATRWICA